MHIFSDGFTMFGLNYGKFSAVIATEWVGPACRVYHSSPAVQYLALRIDLKARRAVMWRRKSLVFKESKAAEVANWNS